MRVALAFLRGDLSAAGRVVPPTGFTARLTLLTAAAMAFLAVFALALSLATGRLADRWSEALARSATIRISAPSEQMQAQVQAVLAVLSTTPGIATYRALESEEMKALLGPWFGPDLPVDSLPLPQLIEVTETAEGIDAEGLRLRLAAEVPGAILDDHTRWRRPLVAAAERLRMLGLLSLVLIGGAMAGMITLAAQAALAANGQVIRVLRLVGARDAFIAKAFVRRFTLRGLAGAVLGTAAGMIAIALLPATDEAGAFLTGLGFAGAGWLWPLVIPPLAAVVAYVATRAAALRMLKGIR
ncbi:cell division protein FtsX [Sedimentimonas flavescens]|uniref:Cell division protein FtsX n=1 Tax=Sedimentimonas flavescens TaxID=2851012 RepID=A0ABT3A2J1_9RHOB|nr:FtsX-like permease family protein [Sedimentimonas flavescens]MBW0159212.1 cell division protein FtsX [Sedimentimonas flavescens]MCV2880201.1 cell division protein FtsX [Sedimentimonas flavescens]WBL33453.1 cell division protein FtsX [Sinirhodobacter sp. HNIBRBA609]